MIGTEEARHKLGELVDRAFYGGERFPLGKHGQLRAWLVPPDEYERFKEWREETR